MRTVTMQLDHSFRTISSRVFRIMGKEKKETRRLEIVSLDPCPVPYDSSLETDRFSIQSAPFNFQHVNASLGGISPDE